MKLEFEEPEEIKLNMTSMIDIVFQLLVFFIMTFKVVVQEGDYNVKMPLATVNENDTMEDPPQLIRVLLQAGEGGVISRIEVYDETEVKTLTSTGVRDLFGNLNSLIESKVAGGDNPEEGADTEVEFDIDYDLEYGYTVRAIEAVSGKDLGDGKVKKLIENIKFKDNTKG